MKFGNDAFAMLQLQAGVPELLLIAQLRLCPLLHGMTWDHAESIETEL